MSEICTQAKNLITEFVEKAGLCAGDCVVVGCSTSEVVGSTIGTNSVPDTAKEIVLAILPILQEKGIFLAGQCCEHLNRAIIVEKEYAKQHGLDAVNVVPVPKAGGSFATALYKELKNPVALEHIRADGGIDIGGTLIGMHLREVAVPLRLSVNTLGKANILCARTRPKFIGGTRAQYDESLI